MQSSWAIKWANVVINVIGCILCETLLDWLICFCGFTSCDTLFVATHLIIWARQTKLVKEVKKILWSTNVVNWHTNCKRDWCDGSPRPNSLDNAVAKWSFFSLLDKLDGSGIAATNLASSFESSKYIQWCYSLDSSLCHRMLLWWLPLIILLQSR